MMRGSLGAMSIMPSRPGPVVDRRAYWWGWLVQDDERFEKLVEKIEGARLDILENKGRLTTHEQVCAERYRRIEDYQNRQTQDMAGINLAVGSIRAELESMGKNWQAALNALANRGETAAWTANWKMWAIGIAVFMTLLSYAVWTSSQLYEMQPLRHAAAPK